MVNNLYANAGDLRDPGSVPVSGKSPEGGHGNLQLGPVFLPGSWTEEPGRLQFIGLQRVRHD